MSLEDWIIRRKISGWWNAAGSGEKGSGMKTVWRVASGWKCVIVLAILVAERMFPGFPGFHYVTLLLQGIGWADVRPSIDPGQVVMVLSAAVAIGHRLQKYLAQYKAFRASGKSAVDAFIDLGALSKA